MRKLVVIFFVLLVTNCVRAQSCLPQGINFYTQDQIDSFQINYPTCTSIEGDVIISGVNITNLEGLSVLNSIEGSLSIGYYENSGNPGLTSLSGLNGLTNIGGYLLVINNLALNSLSGLDGLTNIGSDLTIFNNTLSTLDGLQNLNLIGGSLDVENNYSLLSLTGLNNLSSIGNYINITANPSLTSLAGLNNIVAGSIHDLTIYNNTSLSNCAVQSICNYLASPNGAITILDNAVGCNSPPEIAMECGITLPCLPYGNYYFNSQTEIDNFKTNYPGCASLQGSVYIEGDDIVNLNGFNVITSFGNDLYISYNSMLANLSGLDSVEYIGNKFYIYSNPVLTSLSALAKLKSVGSELYIGYNTTLPGLSGLENLISTGGDVYIVYNDKLNSLAGLSSMNSIRQNLTIAGNLILTSLAGLENLDANSISGLSIHNNNSLSDCSVKSVCDYLTAPNGGVWIYGNAAGCNNELEIINACTVDIEAMATKESRNILFPNPATSQITFESATSGLLSIQNISGQKLLQQLITSPMTSMDISNLPVGVYFLCFIDKDNIGMYKFIKK